MQASEHIIRVIRENGPLSFRDFMNMALYDEISGYYTSGREVFGIEGDYYTSPCMTSVFGAVIGKQLEEMWKLTGAGNFTIVEYGAGNGKLCRDILEYLSHNIKMFQKLKYIIIEKSSRKFDTDFPGVVSIIENIEEIEGFTGCILSNELVDNFPVHRVLMQDELMEIFVDYCDGYAEYLVPADAELKSYLEKWNIHLTPGFHTEINLDAFKWIRETSAALGKGYMITIDYGFAAGELYDKKRSNGTLTCYSRHNKISNTYSDIGNRDITTHVNFSALCTWGKECGFENCGITSQADFLLALGFKQLFIDKYSGT